MFKRLIASLVCLTFSFSSLQYVHAQDFSVNQLPVPGTMIGASAPFAPLALKGLVVNPQKPLEFQFIVDTGRGPQGTASVKDQANQLVKYFLAGLTIPEGDLWVNLSPYEKDRMVPTALGQTDLGRDLLAQDYILKQLTASLIYPEKDLGKEFWSRVYAKAKAQFGTTNVPVNTFNKVWILPDQAQVFENVNAAYVTKSTLKVMLDEDYLAKQKHQATQASSVSSQIVREIVIPEITKEVNTGKNFAPLRQIYQAMILAKWYKETIQNGLLDALYTNKNKVAGVNLNDPAVKEQIYNRYLQAYKKGAFNYIKEDPTPDGQVVPRKYFSGGLTPMPATVRTDGAMNAVKADGAVEDVDVNLEEARAVQVTGNPPIVARNYKGEQVKLSDTGNLEGIIDSAMYASVSPADSAWLTSFKISRLNNVNRISPYLNDADKGVRKAAMDRLDAIVTDPEQKLQILTNFGYSYSNVYVWALEEIGKLVINPDQQALILKEMKLKRYVVLYANGHKMGDYIGNNPNGSTTYEFGIVIRDEALEKQGKIAHFPEREWINFLYSYRELTDEEIEKINRGEIQLPPDHAMLQTPKQTHTIDLVVARIEAKNDFDGYVWADYYNASGEIIDTERLGLRQEAAHAKYTHKIGDNVKDSAMSQPQTSDAAMRTGERGTAVVADDEPSILSLNKRMLELQGFHVLTAASPDELKTVMASHGEEVSLLVTDTTGWVKTVKEVLSKVNNREIRILALSGQNSKEDWENENVPVNAFLGKPYSMQALINEINRILPKDPAMFAKTRLNWILNHNTGNQLTSKLNTFLSGIKDQQTLKELIATMFNYDNDLYLGGDKNGMYVDTSHKYEVREAATKAIDVLVTDPHKKLPIVINALENHPFVGSWATSEVDRLVPDPKEKFPILEKALGSSHIVWAAQGLVKIGSTQALDIVAAKLNALVAELKFLFTPEGERTLDRAGSRRFIVINSVSAIIKSLTGKSLSLQATKALKGAEEVVELEERVRFSSIKHESDGYRVSDKEKAKKERIDEFYRTHPAAARELEESEDYYNKLEARNWPFTSPGGPSREDIMRRHHGNPDADEAMNTPKDKASIANGGIDLDQINVLRNGKKVNVQFDPAQLNALEQGGFEGFTPVIINMTPISSPFQLLGINTAEEPEAWAKV